MQKGLLLVSQLKRYEEARPLNQVVHVVLSRALDNLLIIFQLIDFEDVPRLILFKRVIVERLLIISIRVILQRTHAVRGHGPLVHTPKRLQSEVVPSILLLILIILALSLLLTVLG